MNEGGRGVGREPGASDEGRLDELKFRCLSVDAMVKSPEIPTDENTDHIIAATDYIFYVVRLLC